MIENMKLKVVISYLLFFPTSSIINALFIQNSGYIKMFDIALYIYYICICICIYSLIDS